MVIGTLSVELRLHGTQSLKEKRHIVKRILGRTRETFNVAASEVDDHDRLGRAVLGFAVVGNDARVLNSALDKVLDFVDRLQLAELGESSIEIFNVDPDE